MTEDRRLELAWWQTLERRLIYLIAAHSAAIGVALLLAPEWTLRLVGWGEVTPIFFARQVGVFHLVLAAGYLGEYLRYGGIRLILTAKLIAVVFLFAVTLIEGAPGIVPLAGLSDGLIALAAAMVRRRVQREALS